MSEATVLVTVSEYDSANAPEQRRLTMAQFEALKAKLSVTQWQWSEDRTAVSAETFGTLREFRDAVSAIKKG